MSQISAHSQDRFSERKAATEKDRKYMHLENCCIRKEENVKRDKGRRNRRNNRPSRSRPITGPRSAPTMSNRDRCRSSSGRVGARSSLQPTSTRRSPRLFISKMTTREGAGDGGVSFVRQPNDLPFFLFNFRIIAQQHF